MPAGPTKLNPYDPPFSGFSASRCPSTAHHLDRRLAASFRRDLVRLRSATQTRRRQVGVRGRAGIRRTLLVWYDVGRITIVAVPRRTIVTVPRRTDPYPARAGTVPETGKGYGVVDARRYCDPCRPRNRSPHYWGSKSPTKGHPMAPGKGAASCGGLDRRRNQPGRQSNEETRCNSTGHRAHPVRSSFIYLASSANSRAAVKKRLFVISITSPVQRPC